MKKLVVFLHCKGSFVGDERYSNTNEIADLIAKKYGAELFAFNGICVYKTDRYSWFW